MDSTKTIPWSMAWSHCAGTSSYWLWIAGVCIVAAIGLFVLNKMATKANQSLDTLKLIWCVAAVMALAFAILSAPSTIAANTNYIMAAKNHWIY